MWTEDLSAFLAQIWNWFFNFLVALGMVGLAGAMSLYFAGFFEWALK